MPAIVRVRTPIARRRAAVWADAQRQMRFVVGDDQPDAVDRPPGCGVRRALDLARREPLAPRAGQPPADHRGGAAARPAERGAGFIVNFVHLGDYEGISPSLAPCRDPQPDVATSEVVRPRSADLDAAAGGGRELARRRRAARRGGRLAGIRKALAAGLGGGDRHGPTRSHEGPVPGPPALAVLGRRQDREGHGHPGGRHDHAPRPGASPTAAGCSRSPRCWIPPTSTRSRPCWR